MVIVTNKHSKAHTEAIIVGLPYSNSKLFRCVQYCIGRTIWPKWQLFNVAGYLIEERRRWPIITAPHEGNVINKFRIWKERHFQMREHRTSHLVW